MFAHDLVFIESGAFFYDILRAAWSGAIGDRTQSVDVSEMGSPIDFGEKGYERIGQCFALRGLVLNPFGFLLLTRSGSGRPPSYAFLFGRLAV